MSYKTQLAVSPPLPAFSCHHSIDYSHFGDEVKFGPGSKISPLDNDPFAIHNCQESLCHANDTLNVPQPDPYSSVSSKSPRSPRSRKSPRSSRSNKSPRSPRNKSKSPDKRLVGSSPTNFEASKKPLNEEYRSTQGSNTALPSYYTQTQVSNLDCEVLFTFYDSAIEVKSKFPKGSILYKIVLKPEHLSIMKITYPLESPDQSSYNSVGEKIIPYLRFVRFNGNINFEISDKPKRQKPPNSKDLEVQHQPPLGDTLRNYDDNEEEKLDYDVNFNDRPISSRSQTARSPYANRMVPLDIPQQTVTKSPKSPKSQRKQYTQ